MSNPHDDATHAKIAAEAATRNLSAAVTTIDSLRAKIDALEDSVATLAAAVTNNATTNRGLATQFAHQEQRVAAVEAFRSDIERWREAENADGATD